MSDLRFRLVPIIPDNNQLRAGQIGVTTTCAKSIYAEMTAASPGNDLLERIVRARDLCNDRDDELSFDARCCQLLEILNELGGGYG